MSTASPIDAPTPEAIERAARILIEGGLVALPTETVYGLGADAAQRDAVASIYALKGRPADHPLIVHVIDAAQALTWASFDERALTLAKHFWPGPLTLILPRLPQAPAWACGGEPSIGLRCPSHPVARALLERFRQLGGSGVAAPSANRFGKVSPTHARHVVDDLGEHAPLILDGGPCEVGVESTIVDLTRETARLLRPGRIRREAIEAVLGAPLADRDDQAPRASGTLAAHYSPRAPLELIDAAALAARLADCAQAGLRTGVWSSESPATGPGASLVQWIAAPAQADVWEADLYDALRRFDAAKVDRIIVVRPPASPDWEAVRDRLMRAAAASTPSGQI